ncbi:Abi family protein, partial [Candidatus Parcubacteria bacterium]
FIRHLLDKYDEELPCIWAAVEVMSLGQISRWYADLNARRDRKVIADEYGMDERVLRSFLHHLTTVRNLCAHHARLWNREFTFTPRLPRRPAHLARSLNAAAPRRMYNTLTMTAYLLDIICPGHHFRHRLLGLMEKHHIAPGAMGFPKGWRNLPVWKEATQ